jgi:hypothetical protein
MRTSYEIDKQKMKDIRIQVVKFHIQVNKTIFMLIRLMLIPAIALFIIGILNGFELVFFVFIVAAILFNVIMARPVQLHMAVKQIDNVFRKLAIESFLVSFEADDKGFEISTYLGDKTVQTQMKYCEIVTSQYDSKEDILIFTTGRLASNYAKSRPRYMYLGSLSDVDKLLLIDKFRSNSKKFIQGVTIDKLTKKENTKIKNKNTRNILFIFIAIVAFVAITEIGGFPLFSYGTYPLNEDDLTKSYDQHVTVKTDSSFMVFGYEKDGNDLILSSYFFDEGSHQVFSELQTIYCNVHLETVNENIDKCVGKEVQYGFNSHMSFNMIIRFDKSNTIDIFSNDVEFIYIDGFNDFDYYIASYYGTVKERVDFKIDGRDYTID